MLLFCYMLSGKYSIICSVFLLNVRYFLLYGNRWTEDTHYTITHFESSMTGFCARICCIHAVVHRPLIRTTTTFSGQFLYLFARRVGCQEYICLLTRAAETRKTMIPPFRNRALAFVVLGVACIGKMIKADECPIPPMFWDDCVDARSYADLRNQIHALPPGNRVVFCPFNFAKIAGDKPIFIDQMDVEVICRRNSSTGEECVIDGKGSHIKIDGTSAKVTLQGFTFRGGTKGAVSVANGSVMNEHKICNSDFIGNSNTQGGGALKIDNQSRVMVRNCYFSDNLTKKDGGAINIGGTVRVSESIFIGNRAQVSTLNFSLSRSRLSLFVIYHLSDEHLSH